MIPELVSGSRVQSASIHFINQGAVAQLGERLICIQEVAGSIPTSSTRLSDTSRRITQSERSSGVQFAPTLPWKSGDVAGPWRLPLAPSIWACSSVG